MRRPVPLPTSVFELGESVIREMTRLAEETGAVNLAQGIPERGPPRVVVQAARNAVVEPEWQQYSITWGVRELRGLVGDRYANTRGIDVDAVDADQNVTITCGTMEALHAATRSILRPGDEAILLEPYFENYLPYVLLAGATPVPVPTRPDGRLDPDALQAAFSSRTKAIILNTPNNPTGHVLTPAELALVRDLIVDHDAWAITDEIYEELLYPPHRHVGIASLDGAAERTVTTSGFSKTYNVTGWRVGYAVAPKAMTDRIRSVHDYVVGCAPHPLQRALLAALRAEPHWYEDQRSWCLHARDRFTAMAEAAGFRASVPEGAYYLWADFQDVRFDGLPEGLDDRGFAYWLAKEVGVTCVPGTCFYASDEGKKIGRTRVRFAYAKTDGTLDEVAERFRRALA